MTKALIFTLKNCESNNEKYEKLTFRIFCYITLKAFADILSYFVRFFFFKKNTPTNGSII